MSEPTFPTNELAELAQLCYVFGVPEECSAAERIAAARLAGLAVDTRNTYNRWWGLW